MVFPDLIAGVDRAAQTLLGGEPVTYTPELWPPVTITGIFNDPYVLAKGDAEAGVEALEPTVFLRFEDLPVDPEDDNPTLTIRGIDYRVVERRRVGLGGIVLALRRVA